MPETTNTDDKKIKALVRCIPAPGFMHRSRGGVRFAAGESLHELSPDALKTITEDKQHFIVQLLSDDDFEAARERLGVQLDPAEALRRENEDLRSRIAKGEEALERVVKLEETLSRIEEGFRGFADKMDDLSHKLIQAQREAAAAKPEPKPKAEPKADDKKS